MNFQNAISSTEPTEIAALFARFHLEGKTGCLTLAADAPLRVFWCQGELCNIEGERACNRLPESPNDQLSTRFSSLLSLPTPPYTFDADVTCPSPKTDPKFERLFLDALQKTPQLRVYYRFFGTGAAHPQRLTQPQQLTASEQALFAQCNGLKSINQICKNPADLALLYGFSLLGWIAPANRSTEPPKDEPSKAWLERASELQKLAESNDYFHLLGVSPNATAAEIQAAYENLSEPLSHFKSDPDSSQPIHFTALLDTLRDAYFVLSHPKLRAFYRENGLLNRPGNP